ncbi:MAG: hypothetical protein U0531_05475 [Dehalococcoidia bacterium]
MPCFPFGVPGDMLDELRSSRRFFAPLKRPDAPPLLVPCPPFGLPDSDYVEHQRPLAHGAGYQTAGRRDVAGLPPSRLPLAGVRSTSPG